MGVKITYGINGSWIALTADNLVDLPELCKEYLILTTND